MNETPKAKLTESKIAQLGGADRTITGGKIRPGFRRQLVFRSIQTIHWSTPDQLDHQKTPSHRRRPVPIADMGPGLRREDEEGDAALNHLNAPEH
jgi:hypothetical protein